MLELAQVTAKDVVYDLGSGDGRIPIAAAQRYGALGVGIEIDAKLNREAVDHAKKAGLFPDDVVIVNRKLCCRRSQCAKDVTRFTFL